MVQEGDVVLIWGGAGGLGSMAIQIVREFGGKAVAVVSSEDRAEFCLKLGAVGAVLHAALDEHGAHVTCVATDLVSPHGPSVRGCATA